MTSSDALVFSDAEFKLLDRTADALSAYSGQPVLAEAGITDGAAWAVFGIPLAPDVDAEDVTVWQMGDAQGVRRIGNSGGLALHPNDIIECRVLWAIQMTDGDDDRFMKVDANAKVVAWSDNLADILPFDVGSLDEDEDDAIDDDDDGGSDGDGD